MNHFPRVAAAGLIACLSGAVQATPQPADFWTTPGIEGAGKMHSLPHSAYLPKKGPLYKVVFTVTKGADKPDEINGSLDRVARTVNLYVDAGVRLDHLKFVAVLYGAATSAVLDNEHYRQQLGVDNPNLALIQKLRAAGVDVAVCGQAIAGSDYDYEWVSKSVTVAQSALTTVTTLQTEGYAFLPL